MRWTRIKKNFPFVKYILFKYSFLDILTDQVPEQFFRFFSWIGYVTHISPVLLLQGNFFDSDVYVALALTVYVQDVSHTTGTGTSFQPFFFTKSQIYVLNPTFYPVSATVTYFSPHNNLTGPTASTIDQTSVRTKGNVVVFGLTRLYTFSLAGTHNTSSSQKHRVHLYGAKINLQTA